MWREIGRQVQPRGIKSENSGICGDDDLCLTGDSCRVMMMTMMMMVPARSKLASEIAACFILYNLSVWDKIRDKICTDQEVERLHQTKGNHTMQSKDHMLTDNHKFRPHLMRSAREQFLFHLISKI